MYELFFRSHFLFWLGLALLFGTIAVATLLGYPLDIQFNFN